MTLWVWCIGEAGYFPSEKAINVYTQALETSFKGKLAPNRTSLQHLMIVIPPPRGHKRIPLTKLHKPTCRSQKSKIREHLKRRTIERKNKGKDIE